MQDALIMSTLLLLCFKFLFYFIFVKVFALFNLIFYFYSFIISLKFGLLFYFRELFFVPLIKKSLGYNYYRHNVYDVLDDKEERFLFPKGKLGDLWFFSTLLLNKIARKILTFFVFLNFLILKFPLFFFFFQQILIYILIFFSLNPICWLFTFFFVNAKIIFFLSDFNLLTFLKNINEIVSINSIQELKFTINNIKLLQFWSIRTLEFRETFIKEFDYDMPKEYIEEKIITHNLKNFKIIKKNNFLNYGLLFFLFFLIFIIYSNFSFNFQNFFNLDLWLIGYFTKNNPINNSSCSSKVLMKMFNHRICIKTKKINSDKYEITITPLSSYNGISHLTNQFQSIIGTNLKGPTFKTAYSNNAIHLVANKKETMDFLQGTRKELKTKQSYETATDFLHWQQIKKDFDMSQKSSDSFLATKDASHNTLSLSNLSDVNEDLLADTLHLKTNTKLNISEISSFNDFIQETNWEAKHRKYNEFMSKNAIRGSEYEQKMEFFFKKYVDP